MPDIMVAKSLVKSIQAHGTTSGLAIAAVR